MQCLMQDVKALTPQLKIPQGLEEQVQKALEEFGIGDLNDENDPIEQVEILPCGLPIFGMYHIYFGMEPQQKQ